MTTQTPQQPLHYQEEQGRDIDPNRGCRRIFGPIRIGMLRNRITSSRLYNSSARQLQTSPVGGHVNWMSSGAGTYPSFPGRFPGRNLHCTIPRGRRRLRWKDCVPQDATFILNVRTGKQKHKTKIPYEVP